MFTRSGRIRDEWDSIKKHDVVFLITIAPNKYVDEQIDPSKHFLERYGVKFIRGCEVMELMDEQGNPIRDMYEDVDAKNKKSGHERTLKVKMDSSQYQKDLNSQDRDVYGSFNLLVRR